MMVPASAAAITLRGIDMNESDFVKKWGHMFQLIKDKDLLPGNTAEDIPILMLRDALPLIEERVIQAALERQQSMMYAEWLSETLIHELEADIKNGRAKKDPLESLQKFYNEMKDAKNVDKNKPSHSEGILTKATKNNGKCDACHLDILKGEDYREYTNDDIYKIHELCADLIEYGGKMPVLPNEVLNDLIYCVYGVSPNDEPLLDIVKDDPRMFTATEDEDFLDMLDKWRHFFIQKVTLAKTNTEARE